MVKTAARINHILKHTHDLSVNDLESLEHCIEQYPWFQAARSLQLKTLKDQSSPLYNKALQVTATHTADRSVLFDYITSPYFAQNKISQQIQQQYEELHQIEVITEEIKVVEENLNQSVDHTQTLEKDLFLRSNPTNITDQPFEFTKQDGHSFTEWLQLTSLQPVKREQPQTTTTQKETKNKDIIDKFLAEKPKITPRKSNTNTKNLADLNNPKPQLMTQTLAQVYAAQKNYEKAIQAYQILKLQHPEKSGYFADRIRELKKLQSIT